MDVSFRGDTAGAIEAMRLAADSARPASPRLGIAQGGEPLRRRRPDRRGTCAVPPDPRGGRRGTRRPTVGWPASQATPSGPRASTGAPCRSSRRRTHAVGLADALAQLGRAAASERYLRHAHELETQFARFGGRNEVETALLDLDHDRNLRRALRRAWGARLRPSVEGEHVLAWALYKNGRCAEHDGTRSAR